MRKNFGGKIVKRAMAVALAVVISAGSILPATAAAGIIEPSYVQGDNYVDPNKAKFNNTETKIDPVITENVEAAQAAADVAATAAADAATAAADAATAAQDAADEATKAATAATAAADAATVAQDAADAAVEVVGEAPVEPNSVTNKTPDTTLDSAWEEVGELKDTVETIQAERDEFQKELEDSVGMDKNLVDTSVLAAQDAAEAAEAAKDAAEAAVLKAQSTSDINVVKEAQTEAKKAALTAEEEAQKAESAYQEALAKLADAQKSFKEMKKEYKNKLKDDNNYIEDKKDEINGILLSDSTISLNDAEKAYTEALLAATKAAEAALEASDASASASDEAKKLMDDSNEQAEIATEKADAAMNYYVDPAQTKYDEAIQNKEAQDIVVSDLETLKNSAENNYNAIIAETTAATVDSYTTELAKKEKAMTDAKAYYDSISKLNLIKRAIAKDAYNKAKDTYNNYNTAKTKNNLIDTALKNTTQYKSLATSNTNLDAAKSTLTKLETDAQAKATALANTKAVKEAYLKSIEAAHTEEQKNEIANALKAIVGETSDNINQTQYDADLNDWANKFWNGFLWEDSVKDAKKVRTDFQTKYDESSEFRKFVEKYSIIQWSSNNTEKLIAAVEQAYYAVLLKQEEELATVNAFIAKTDATGASENAEKASNAAIESARLAKLSADAAQLSADFTTSQEKLEAAKTTLAKAELSLAAAKEAAKAMNATSVSFKNVKKMLRDAQDAVDRAKEAAEKALQDAKEALDAKNKVDSIIANWKYDSDDQSVVDNDGIDELAIASTIVAAPTVQVATINETPVALAATSRRARTVATGTTEIEEEATPAVAQPEVVAKEAEDKTANVKADTTEISDEETALASTMQEDGFAWWWILILIAIVSGGSLAGYRYYKNKKVVEE